MTDRARIKLDALLKELKASTVSEAWTEWATAGQCE